MAKKCIICGEKAEFQIKNGSESYCEECAQMQFGDIALLQKLETDAKKLKRYLEEKDNDEVEFKFDEDMID